MERPEDYLTRAEKLAATSRGVPDAGPGFRSAAVVGAGTMGGGITMALTAAGIDVTLIDQTQEGLDRGLASIRKNLERTVARGRLSAEDAAERLARINLATDLAAIRDAEVVIEAVWEQMALKKSIFATIDEHARSDAVLGTNTSTLNIDEIAQATGRPEAVIGLHFFSPAHVMKLLEVVRGARTSPETIGAALRLAQQLGKSPVVVGVCDGFVGNRIFGAREREAQRLLVEGATPQQVDRVLVEFGFPMGTFTLSDLTNGVELTWRMRQARGETEFIGDKLAELGRFGQKAGKGYYSYGEDGRTPIPDPIVDEIIVQASQAAGVMRRDIPDEEVLDRLILPMINEGAKILDEGIADRASDIDVIWSRGYGWPISKGGPMYHADTVGVAKVRDRLLALSREHGARFAPAPALGHVADSGGRFTARA